MLNGIFVTVSYPHVLNIRGQPSLRTAIALSPHSEGLPRASVVTWLSCSRIHLGFSCSYNTQHSAAVMSNLSGHVDALVNQCGTMERIRGWDSGTPGLWDSAWRPFCNPVWKRL